MNIKDFNIGDLDLDSNFDFGIKSVSSDQVDQSKIQTEKLEQVSATSENVSQKLEQIEGKIAEVLAVAQQKFDTRLEEKELQLEVGNQDKFRALEKLMIPLLMNLAKDSESNPYIHWPNRKEVVEDQIRKILTVTRTENIQ